ncbi:hypothetical protein [Kibdelosporangium phytohabitans]|uniref:Uncharacterized protein n=1 Tax=Kibdelosporangium phytohabitans TaxID=860235 RepID=A0A0N9I2R4_9PSEU|nr:hypothetical protein [Kibdelosporangium phytohabitans]ALG10326.1 hypothetical protein AOZ06_28595 [Kibdelosporangium phytohabitans]MBE1461365.1 hypothetical protein [Kibdelosporangium phytohabitans]
MTTEPDTNQPTPDAATDDPFTDDIDGKLAQLVADRAPRLFGVVIEHEAPKEPEIAAWGMDFDDSAYMITVDGKTQFALASADNALFYVRTTPEAIPHLIYTTAIPASPNTDDE